MRIVYVVGMAMGELAQAKAIAFYAKKKGDQNIFIAKEPKLISSIKDDGFKVIPTKNTSMTQNIIKKLEPDVVFCCNSKSVSIVEDPILDKPPLPPKPLVCSLDSNWLFSQDKRAFFTSPPWIDRIYVVFPSSIYLMGLWENGGHYKIPKYFKKKILPVGFVPSGNKIPEKAKQQARKKLKLKEDEKLIFIYFGFFEKLLAPAFFPLLKKAVENFSDKGKNLKILFKGKYDVGEKYGKSGWIIHYPWFKTEEEFNTHLACADLVIQHHGLGTLPKTIHNLVPTICLVPEIKRELPYYRHSEYYEIEPFMRLGLCETLPYNITSRKGTKSLHFFITDPKHYPISNLSISFQRLEELLNDLLYDEDRIERMRKAQKENFEKGEENVYNDLINILKERTCCK